MSQNTSTTLIIFGATGDLVSKKIIPSLYNLYKQSKIDDKFNIIAFARRDFNDGKYNQILKDSLINYGSINIDNIDIDKFLCKFTYFQGDFDTLDSYSNLIKVLKHIDNKNGTVSNKLLYLAVPPENYKELFLNLNLSNFVKEFNNIKKWTRIIVEKPFGENEETSTQLNKQLNDIFNEDQIYRIDHYLEKDMLVNIMSFRFNNTLFEPIWNNQFIEKIEIKTLENIGVENRGNFYDKVGTLKDVGQNHLLQMLALITMDKPVSNDTNNIRESRNNVFKSLKFLSKEDIMKNTYRAQYKGYREIENVDKNSNTETYFKLKCFINSSRWQNVPIILEAGKRLKDSNREIIITFKTQDNLTPNQIIFSINNKEEIIIKVNSNNSNNRDIKITKDFKLNFRDEKDHKQYIEEYSTVFLDVINGKQTFFVSSEEIKTMWRFIDPIVLGWKENLITLESYEPNSNIKQNKIV